MLVWVGDDNKMWWCYKAGQSGRPWMVGRETAVRIVSAVDVLQCARFRYFL